jgi:hypothetical protein
LNPGRVAIGAAPADGVAKPKTTAAAVSATKTTAARIDVVVLLEPANIRFNFILLLVEESHKLDLFGRV